MPRNNPTQYRGYQSRYQPQAQSWGYGYGKRTGAYGGPGYSKYGGTNRWSPGTVSFAKRRVGLSMIKPMGQENPSSWTGA